MNEQNVKALFMAQYYQSKAALYSNGYWHEAKKEFYLNYCTRDDAILLLRSVSQLTDDEKKHIHYYWDVDQFGTILIKPNTTKLMPDYYISLSQYLLRIGILLPFTYLNENNQPVTLQPEEIIAKGWAKTL